MKKKAMAILFSAILGLALCAGAAFAIIKATQNPAESTEQLENRRVSFKTLSVDGDKVYGKVSNDTKSFSFINEIKTVGLTKFIVSLDIYGSQQVETKTIPLSVGDNVVYVIEMLDGEPQAIYEVTIRRRPVYTVTFNTSNGTKVPDQKIEEDSCVAMPDSPERKGYIFDKWNYNFSTPVTKNTTIDANWNIITYNIFYNLNGGIIDGENPTTYTIEDEITLIEPIKRGYKATWDNGGKIEKGTIGDITFSAAYTPIVYKITYDCGNGTNNELNPLEYTIESETIVLNDAYYINADFVEWRQGDVKISEIVNGSIGDVTLTAVWNEYDVKLRKNGDSYTVIGLNTNKTDIVIKSSYKGKNITSIGRSAFSHCSGLTSITIPDSVTLIGESAFSGCSGLTNIYINDVSAWCNISGLNNLMEYGADNKNLYLNGELVTDLVIPDNVTSIDSYAFRNCSGITSITIPNSIKSINSSAFSGCGGLANIYINDISAWCNISGLSNLMGYGASNKNLYLNGGLVTDLVIPDNITSINSYAFRNCSGITSITIQDSVASIDSFAFYGCSSLEAITLPFIGASKTASNGYDQVFGYIFGYTTTSNSSSLSGATYQYYTSDSNSGRNKYYHYYIPLSLKTVILSDHITSIGNYAFKNCSGFTNIIIPNSVTSIGDSAFSGCSSLESITVPFVGNKAGVTSEDAYQYPFGYFFGTSSYSGGVATEQYYGYSTSSAMTNTYYIPALYYIPASLKTVTITGGNLLYGAFYNCSGLISVTIPDNVTSIDSYAFYNCSGLTSVTIPNSVTLIDSSAFSNCSELTNIYINDVSTWCNISGLNNLMEYGAENKNLYLNGELVTDLVIPDNVTSIDSYAFRNCSGITSITIPNSIKSINSSAFSGCGGLTSVIWNAENFISTGSNFYPIFENCSSLSNVTIGENVKTIPTYIFTCSGLTSIEVASGNKKYYSQDNCIIETETKKLVVGCKSSVIPKDGSVTSIDSYAFKNCSGLTNIIIPDSVTSIGESAFYGCLSLKSITLPFIGASEIASNGYDQVFGYIFGYTTTSNSSSLSGATYQYYTSDSNSGRNKYYHYYIPSSLKNVILSDHITSIGNYAFYNCSGLTSITIPNSVTAINSSAFV